MLSKRLFSTLVKYISGEKIPSLCKDCKYFRPDTFYAIRSKSSIEFGKCGKRVDIDVVTGKKHYNYASVERQHYCKGNFFEERYPSK